MDFDPIVLKKLRKTHPGRPSQEDLAAALGINRATYGKKENGAITISLQDLELLAEFYGMDVSEFFDAKLHELEIPKQRKYKKRYRRVITGINTGLPPAAPPHRPADTGDEREVEELKNLILDQARVLNEQWNEIKSLKAYIADLESKFVTG